jgi:hypothetical protein
MEFSSPPRFSLSLLIFSALFALTTSTVFASGSFVWTDQTSAGSRSWDSVTSSSDGTKLAATVGPGDIYTSTDGGVTWTVRLCGGLIGPRRFRTAM